MINNYKNAEKLLETKNLVLNAYPKINWINDTTFWYDKEKYSDDKICSEKIKVNCICKEISLFEDNTNEKDDVKEIEVFTKQDIIQLGFSLTFDRFENMISIRA